MNNTLSNLIIPLKNKMIAFYHLPKTAGTNFSFIIENNYKNRCIKNNKAFTWVNKNTRNIECAFGHHGYQAAVKNPNSVIFMFLRNPIERTISHFVEHRNNKYIGMDFSLKELFIDRPNKYFGPEYPAPYFAKRAGFHGNAQWASNFYCRALTGSGFIGSNPYPITQKICNTIKENMENNLLCFKGKNIPTILGITERFDESVRLFQKVAGWKTIKYVEKSRNRAYNHGKRRIIVSKEIVREIALRNRLDMQIYNTAKQLFDQQLNYFGVK